MPVKGRAAQALLSLKKQFGVDADGYVNVDLNRQDIASYTGSTYETLFRMINEMLKDDLIAVNGKRFLLKNEPALLKLTEEDHVTGV
jgi:CRP/FNR family transcriptional regulator